jgi:hypothetical protein
MTTPPTPQAISALLRNAGFAGYGGEHWGFSVFKAALGPDIIVEIRGVSLLEYNPGEGPRALLDDYEAAITAAGYQVRSTGSELIVPPTPPFTEGPVTEGVPTEKERR